MNTRPLIALTFLLALVGCSVDEHAGGYPFEMKGFYPGMPGVDFHTLAQSYGGSDESADLDWEEYSFPDNTFTLGGLRVDSMGLFSYEADATGLIVIDLHEDTSAEDVQRLREILLIKYGLSRSALEGDVQLRWRTESDQFDDRLVFHMEAPLGPSISMERSEVKADPEDF